MTRWRIELLGGVRATRDGLAVTRFRTHKAEALLGVLAFRRDRPQPRELLTDMLWPDSEAGVGRNNLSRELSSLRHLLEPPGVRPGSVIVAGRTTVQLDPAAVTTDVAELDEALARATGPGRIEALRAALTLHAGELLPGHYQDWVEPERVRLRAAVVRAARDLAAELEQAGDRAGAVEALRRAVRTDPLAEEAHRELMALHAAAGEPALGLRLFTELEARLRRELGQGPAPATVELARRLAPRATPAPGLSPGLSPGPAPARAGLVSVLALAPGQVRAFDRPADALAAHRRAPAARAALDTGVAGPALEARAAALAAVARPGTLLVSERTAPLLGLDLGGDLRLVDLGRWTVAGADERLYRLEGAGLVADDPDARRVATAALPLELTRFVGREALLAELQGQLAPGAARLLTITGPGGIGKTRLALELARALAPGRAGALWFVPLASVTDPARVPEAIAEALGLPRPAGLDEVARALDGRAALLVLDNLEQLDAAPVGGEACGADVVRALLERAPACAVLATSRRRLGIAGEREQPLGPLPVEAGVELFVDRARAVRPDFARTAENAGAIAELVRRLDGVPLALALAAGRAQVLSPAQLLARLGERFDLLVSRSPDVPERHRTLAAALAWSTDLLADDRRHLFARLTVFRGPFRLEAAEAVTKDPLVLDALSELRECSLLLAEGDARGGVLFRLLDTLRELAAAGLDPAERPELERRHAEHYRALAEEAEPRLHGPGGQDWFRRLADEYPNLRAALERGAASPALAPVALGLARALRSYWFGAGPIRDVAALLPPLLAAAPARTADRAAALWALGLHLARAATVEESRPPLEESLGIWREVGNGPMATGVVLTLAEALSRAGEDEAARARYREGLALARAAGDERRLAWGLGALAQHLLFQDEPRAALPLLEEALALNEGRDVPQHAIERWRLAELRLALGEGQAAAALAAQALEALAGLGFASSAARCRALLGRARVQAGDRSGAALLEEALADLRATDRPDSLALTLLDLADAALADDDDAAARAWKDECARLVRPTCEPLFLDRLLRLEGDLARRAGDAAGARERYAACLAHVAARKGWGRAQALPPALEGLAALEELSGAEGAARAAALLGQAARARADRAPPPPARRAWLAALERHLRATLGDAAYERATAAGP